MPFIRNRTVYFFLILITISLGLLSRAHNMPIWVHEYVGDILYALMIYWGFAFIFCSKKPNNIWAYTLLFCYGIELTQLYQSHWILNIRSTTIGSLILGHGFLWSDIICYTIGSSVGYLLERIYYRHD